MCLSFPFSVLVQGGWTQQKPKKTERTKHVTAQFDWRVNGVKGKMEWEHTRCSFNGLTAPPFRPSASNTGLAAPTGLIGPSGLVAPGVWLVATGLTAPTSTLGLSAPIAARNLLNRFLPDIL